MSKSDDQRLTKIEQALSPKEAVLMWLDQAHEFGSLQDYTTWLRDQPAEVFPLIHLPWLMQESARTRTKGQKEDAVWRATRTAVRDVAFLFNLVTTVNMAELRERRQRALELCCLLQAVRPALARSVPWDEGKTLEWKHAASALLRHLLAQQAAIDRISHGYFDGRSPLFPEAAQYEQKFKGDVEEIVASYNVWVSVGWLGFSPTQRQSRRLEINLDLAPKKAEEAACDLAQQWVVMAKSEALSMIGEEKQAWEQARRLWESL